ncbi:MAG TPA: hypothetical protein VF862_13440 [Gemmatimonadales bacterium]
MRRAFLLLALLAPAQLQAQLGEVHVGLLGSVGTGAAWGPGFGAIVGVAPGRLTYMGLRLQAHRGPTEELQGIEGLVGVRTRMTVFAADIGIMLPVGPVEVMPGIALGVLRFSQQVDDPMVDGGFGTPFIATELYPAPTLAVLIRVKGIHLIPEIQADLAGSPDLPAPVTHRGLMFGLRVVVPFEVDRIRH